MEKITEAQRLLIQYFKALGATQARIVYLMALLWIPEEAEEMIRYIAETGERDLTRLSEIAYEISQKHEKEETKNQEE